MRGFWLLVVALILVPAAAGVSVLGCYDTTKPAPPCTISGGDGCYPLVHDQRAPDGGR